MLQKFAASKPLAAAVAMLLALCAPLGWAILRALGAGEDASHVYWYLTVPTLAVCGAAGWKVAGMQARIQELSERDDLTGLFNQNAFLRTAGFLLQLAIRHKEPVSFLMMDIDHFKDVNDNHNHLVGSYVIKEIARIITESTRKSDLVARFGGDEYVLCLPRTSLDDARVVAERIRQTVENRSFTLRNHTVNVTVSLGIAAGTAEPGHDVARLLEIADGALYAAKDEGRNRVAGKTLARPA